jgi:hypothetical protein
MRRLLAPALATALALVPATARAEPYDIDLRDLGNPETDPTALARFGILSSDLALALTAAVLTPASTTGHSGFDVALEAAYTGVHPDPVGGSSPWQTIAESPHELLISSIRVRKALPYSVELGGRILNVSQSNFWAGQIELRWALNEGFHKLPDLAIRAAHTQLFLHRDWNLSATDFDVSVSKSFPFLGVLTLTPYLAARFTFVGASSDPIVFTPNGTGDPQQDVSLAAQFPNFRSTFFRSTLGCRLRTYVVSMAAEVTYSGGGEQGGDEYPTYDVPSSFGGAFRFGFEF